MPKLGVAEPNRLSSKRHRWSSLLEAIAYVCELGLWSVSDSAKQSIRMMVQKGLETKVRTFCDALYIVMGIFAH